MAVAVAQTLAAQVSPREMEALLSEIEEVSGPAADEQSTSARGSDG